MEIKKTAKGDILPSCLQVINGQLFVKSPVEALITLWSHFIINTLPNPITPQTVMNALKQSDFCAVVKMKHPLLKKAHRLECLKFARYHEKWTVEDWKRILWSDETKINRIGSDGRDYTWKKKGEPLSNRTTTPTVKHGGGNNLMIWGCMGWNGVWMLTEVQGIMDGEQFWMGDWWKVLKSWRCQRGRGCFSRTMTPNTPPRRQPSGLKTTTLKSAQSPDISPIERLWVDLKKALKKYPKPPRGVHELWDRVVEEWNKIPPETCQNLIE